MNKKTTFRAALNAAFMNVFLVLGLFSLSPVSSHAEDTPRPEVAKYVKAYSSFEGARVWVLRIGPPEDNTFIIQVGGIDHPLDMKIMVAHVEETNKDKRYGIDNAGNKFVLLIVGDYGGELYLPGTSKTISLRYDDALSQSSNAEHFLTDYLSQAK